jgi:glyoxylase-like metal-dependent hydrolase (beta-lactamase superfamily II)
VTWQVEVLHYGEQRVPGAQVFHQADWDRWHTFNFYAFLLTGPDGVVLIDCGMDDPGPLNHAIEGSMGERGCIHHVSTGGMVTDLLAARGISPSDVDLVALTHLHADHAGNVGLFDRAQYAVGRRGWEAHLRRRESHPGLVSAPAFPTDALAVLDGAAGDGRLVLADDDEQIAPDLNVRTIGGHTDDSTAFVVDSDRGRLVFPGDTIWTYANLDTDHPVGSHVDVPACMDAMAWARGAGDLVVPSHDPLVLDRVGTR